VRAAPERRAVARPAPVSEANLVDRAVAAALGARALGRHGADHKPPFVRVTPGLAGGVLTQGASVRQRSPSRGRPGCEPTRGVLRAQAQALQLPFGFWGDDRPERRRPVRVAAARPASQGDQDRACRGRGHVLLDDLGVQSAQRLGIGDFGGNVVVALWPGELKEQARYLSRPAARAADDRRGAGARLDGRAEPPPRVPERLPDGPPLHGAAPRRGGVRPAVGGRGPGAGRGARPGVRQRRPVAVAQEPRLRHRPRRPVLEEWLDTRLGNRPALLRPGLRLKRTWPGTALASPGEASALV
jgi:hypothetical protein